MHTYIDYRKVREDWIECGIQIGNHSIKMAGSYHAPAPKDLFAAVNFLLGGGIRSQCAFDTPQGGYLLMLKRDGTILQVDVYELSEPYTTNANIKGELVFSEQTPLAIFADILNQSRARVH